MSPSEDQNVFWPLPKKVNIIQINIYLLSGNYTIMPIISQGACPFLSLFLLRRLYQTKSDKSTDF